MPKPLSLMLLMLTMLACEATEPESPAVSSPNENIRIEFFLTDHSSLHYRVLYRDTPVIDTSAMAFLFRGQEHFDQGLHILGSEVRTVDETWEMPWGEQREVRNHYRELVVELTETMMPNRRMNIYFRAYDDGIAFRYEFLPEPGVEAILITEERTEFKLTGDHQTWWQPGDWDIYEHLYRTTRLSEIDATQYRDHPNLAQTYIPANAVNTPVTMRTDAGLYLSFHEADLTEYAGMTLQVDPDRLSLTSNLVGSERRDYKVKHQLPFLTPWRTVQISEDAAGLIESRLIENLNPPNQLGDIPWFKPMKYVGIWWEMHLGISSWDMASGKHGATTENAKRYIDFAAANNIGGVLVEGWNTGWERWIGFEDREGVFDFVTPYPDYDLEEVVAYAKSKGVEIIMHHETSAAPRTYEQQLDTAFALMQRLGIHSVKTGYVGKIIPKGEYHHGQWMVNHYRKVLEKGAEYQIAINAHEPIKATGIRRTLPNAIAREGLRGQEFNAWATDGGNPPEHLPIVAFTRMLAGPIDFTPGVFDLLLPQKENNRINTTLAQQLALYVVIYSPIQMACDLPENYAGHPAFQFIRDVGVDWEQSRVLNGEVGDFVTIAREERGTGSWFIGGITDEEARELPVRFDFLEPGVEYEAIHYQDGPDAHWRDNPGAYAIDTTTVTAATERSYRLAPGGGFAVSLRPRR